MKTSRLAVLKGVGWTTGAFGLSQLIRLVTVVVVARLLAPELFGIMAIMYSVRTGIDLLSDLGIGQNVVQNKNGDDPDFLNTAWTLQLIRGPVLWLICAAAALPFAHFYDTAILASVLPIAALYFLLLGFSSISIPLLQRRLQLTRLNAFDLFSELVSALALLVFAYLSPTVWALALGSLAGPAARMIASYFLLPDLRQRIYISKDYALQIFTFGKWIFLSSLVYFLAMNFDRLFLGKIAPLSLLGVYGVARSLSDPIGTLVVRLCTYVLFPVFASNSGSPRDSLRTQVGPIRTKFLILAAVGVSLFAALADFPVRILYDERYQAAAWMLPLMAIGLWFSIICSINETTLLGFGKPHYGAFANTLKLLYLLTALPLGFTQYGPLGAVVVISVSDASRYGPILVGQMRERFSFGMQDLALTVMVLALIAIWEWLRFAAGFGTSFDNLPLGRIF